jgi:predicted DNA-binding helix-hairpin-helix protein
VKINTCRREALLRVPGLGPETARRILEFRKERRITRIEDIGVKGRRSEKAKRYVIFE